MLNDEWNYVLTCQASQVNLIITFNNLQSTIAIVNLQSALVNVT